MNYQSTFLSERIFYFIFERPSKCDLKGKAKVLPEILIISFSFSGKRKTPRIRRVLLQLNIKELTVP
jgi:hypothetical protein